MLIYELRFTNYDLQDVCLLRNVMIDATIIDKSSLPSLYKGSMSFLKDGLISIINSKRKGFHPVLLLQFLIYLKNQLQISLLMLPDN